MNPLALRLLALKVVIASMLNRVDLNKLGHVELILDEVLFLKVARL